MTENMGGSHGKDVPVLYQKKEECCGCAACYAICPNAAIAMEEDEEGFVYPRIHQEKCARCCLCVKVCQATQPYVYM